jgi:hypothetical protein
MCFVRRHATGLDADVASRVTVHRRALHGPEKD